MSHAKSIVRLPTPIGAARTALYDILAIAMVTMKTVNPKTRSSHMKRVRRYVAVARQRRDSKRVGQAIGLPVAGFVAIVSAQLAILSANGELTLSAAAPMVWFTLGFTGLLAVFMTWFQR